MKSKHFYIIIFIATVLFLAILVLMPKSLVSSTNASYKTELEQNGEASIAKWNIVSLDKDGKTLTMDVNFIDKLEEKSEGNWFFQILNASEVAAVLNKDSKIVLRLDHENFSGLGDEINWNFLEGNNPISFNIYLYNNDIDSVLKYKKENDVIKYSDYVKLNDVDKKGYSENITDGESVVSIPSTNDTKLLKKTDNGKTYYELECKFNINDYILNINDKLTLRLEWKVDLNQQNSESSSTPTTSTTTESEYKYYKLVKKDDKTKDMFIVEGTQKQGYAIDGVKYYIVYQVKEYFDYLNCFGYEPLFSIITSEGNERISFSKLTAEQINGINSYSIGDSPTLTDLNNYVEKLTYEQFCKFQEYATNYEKQQGYLGYGLTCSIQFYLHVSQID